MDLGKIEKSKKIDISMYFGEGEFLTIKYIPREVWQKINRLGLKRSDTLLYSEYKKKYGDVDCSDGDKKNDVEKITDVMRGIPVQELEAAQEIEAKTNRMIIDYGLSESDHSFTDGGKPVKLSFDVIQQIGHAIACEKSFYDWLLAGIREYNSGFDLGETSGTR